MESEDGTMRGGGGMRRRVVSGMLVLVLVGTTYAATMRLYVDDDGEEWQVCRDDDGYVVRHVESGETHTWGAGYRWVRHRRGP